MELCRSRPNSQSCKLNSKIQLDSTYSPWHIGWSPTFAKPKQLCLAIIHPVHLGPFAVLYPSVLVLHFPIRFGLTLSSFSTVFFNHSAAEEYFEGEQITASKHECAHLLLGNLSCPIRPNAPNFCPIRPVPVCGIARARDYAAGYERTPCWPQCANVTPVRYACGRCVR